MNHKKEKTDFMELWKKYGRAWKLWWKLSPRLFLVLIPDCAFRAFCPYVTIWISSLIVSQLTGARNPERLFSLITFQLIFTAATALSGGLLERWKHYETDAARQQYDKLYMNNMFRLDYEDIDCQHTHDLYSQITQNEQWSGLGISETITMFQELFLSLFQILGGIVLTGSCFSFFSHPLSGAAILGLVILGAAAASFCTNQTQKYWVSFAAETRSSNRLADFYIDLTKDRKRAPDLRIYRQQEQVGSVYMRQNLAFTPKSWIARCARGSMGLWAVMSESIPVVCSWAIYLAVCLKAWAGVFDVGYAARYIASFISLSSGISCLFKVLGRMSGNCPFLDTCYEFLDIPNAMYQGSLTTEKRSDRQYDIEFRDVSFRYPGAKTWALSHVNMKFPVGSRLAVVGLNGSGKTTFIKLLCRLYDPTQGQILLNGIDIRKYRYDDYIRLFSVVFQDFQLFSLPLGQNVAGAFHYDPQRVRQCLDKAGFSRRFDSLPLGLDTFLYKDLDAQGTDISGGEAQKIAIARALYQDSPFLILDEPTAALDPVTEAEIYLSLNDLLEDRTVVYISHRLSSCRFCHRIAVFHQGTVAETGTHEELLAKTDSLYHQLWTAQAQYYK